MKHSRGFEPTGRLVLRAGAAVLDAGTVLSRVEIEVAAGRIVSIGAASELTRAESELVVTAGLVNAHAHLDLGALAGRVEAGPSFLSWVARIVEARAGLTADEVAGGVRRSVDALLDSGTTTVIDIDGAGGAADTAGASPMRRVELREIIDGSPADWGDRSEAALEAARGAVARPVADICVHGVSPHGTHTVGDRLLARVAALEPRGPIAVHWAETAEECEWLEHGTGPFAAWLGPSPRSTGTARLAAAGLLEGALLVHGNHPQPGELERVARAGATVVHCPGSHIFFGRAPFPAPRYLAAGIPLALGTDSWASNDALDMRREMRLARETLGLSAAQAWRMATEVGAAQLPWPHVTGRIEVGAAADLAVFRLDPRGGNGVGGERVLETLTSEDTDVVAVFVAGERVRG